MDREDGVVYLPRGKYHLPKTVGQGARHHQPIDYPDCNSIRREGAETPGAGDTPAERPGILDSCQLLSPDPSIPFFSSPVRNGSDTTPPLPPAPTLKNGPPSPCEPSIIFFVSFSFLLRPLCVSAPRGNDRRGAAGPYHPSYQRRYLQIDI